VAAAIAAALLSACPAASHGSPSAGGPGSPTTSSPHSTPSRVPAKGVPAVDLPNRALTPGVALSASVAQICVPGYSGSVRHVPQSEKEAVYARYGVAHVPYRHEVDHLISLEIGGSNDIRNLWPEPYAGQWGARTKDVLENRLHLLVCSGQLSLLAAQHQEAANWVAAYRRYVGRAPPAPSPSSSGGFYASSYPTARFIYCADDPGGKSLSTKYLVHFTTLAQAHTRFPNYHLHRPC
jgi:hypothetical protein